MPKDTDWFISLSAHCCLPLFTQLFVFNTHKHLSKNTQLFSFQHKIVLKQIVYLSLLQPGVSGEYFNSKTPSCKDW